MFFFFKQKTAYEMRISDWSSDVCSSDLVWPVGARCSGAVWGERSQCGALVAASSADWRGGAGQAGRTSQTGVAARAGLAAGARCGRAGLDLARLACRVGRARGEGELRRLVAVPRTRGIVVQKKPVRQRAGPTADRAAANAVEEDRKSTRLNSSH